MILRWGNLKTNRCPQCSGNFNDGLRHEGKYGDILKHPCGFRISETKLTNIHTRISGINFDEKYEE